MKLTSLCILVAALAPTYGQDATSLAGGGYSAPAPVLIAPGQVVTLFFHGIPPLENGQLRSGQASAVPLPTTLAGLSLRFTQSLTGAVNAPIFAVRQQPECDGAFQPFSPSCLLTSVKIEVPFEIISSPITDHSSAAPAAELTIDVDNQVTRSFSFQPIPDNAHVLTACDVSWDTSSSSVCNRKAYHADGSAVTAAQPAHIGETVVVYAFGLGSVSGTVRTGDGSPATLTLAGLVEQHVKANFRALVNGLSSVPRFPSDSDSNSPGSPIAFAGLTPGQIGLYQLNIAVPALDLAGACGGMNGFIQTNATLSITTSQGTESLAFCIQP